MRIKAETWNDARPNETVGVGADQCIDAVGFQSVDGQRLDAEAWIENSVFGNPDGLILDPLFAMVASNAVVGDDLDEEISRTVEAIFIKSIGMDFRDKEKIGLSIRTSAAQLDGERCAQHNAETTLGDEVLVKETEGQQ